MADTILKINHIHNEGEIGQFQANASNIGWRSDAGRQLVYRTPDLKRAEWYEGQLRVLFEEEANGEKQILTLGGFRTEDSDLLWRFFSEHNVFLKKHRRQSAISEETFDAAIKNIEDSADAVDDAEWGSVQKRVSEADLMVKVESIHDSMDQALGGDRAALSRAFAANGCERIGRLRLLIETVQLEVYAKDLRWKHLSVTSQSIESVLKELGTFRCWKPPEEDSSMAKRQMARELKKTIIGEANPLRETPMCKVETPPSLSPLLAAPVSPAQVAAPILHPLAASGGSTVSPAPLRRSKQDYEPPRESPRDSAGDRRDEENADAALRSAHHTSSGSIHEGWVWKRSRFLKLWKRRWVVLMPWGLQTYKDTRCGKPTEIIHRGIRNVTSADLLAQLSHCFCVQTDRRSYYMVCDDEEQKAAWLRDIARTLCS